MSSGPGQDAIDVIVNVETFSSEGEFDDHLPVDLSSSSSESDLDDFEREGDHAVSGTANEQSNALAAEFDWDKYGTMNELRDQVGLLQSVIENKDSMIESLNDTIASLRQELTSALSSDAQECAKDIAQKNRALRLALTRATAENARLAAQVQQLREIVGASSESDMKPSCTETEVELKQWKSKYKAKATRLASAQVQISALKNEIASFRRVLKAEIGSNEGVEKALNGAQSNWRGRAAEIARLSAKLKQQQQQQQQQQPWRHDGEGVGPLQHSPLPNKSHPKYDAVRLQHERSIEREQLISEVVSVKHQLTAMKTRCESGVARNRTLEEQIVAAKAKMKILIDKSCADDKLIETLKDKIKQGAGERLRLAKLQQEIGVLRAAVTDHEQLVGGGALRDQLEARTAQVASLEANHAQLMEDLITDWDRRAALQRQAADQLEISNLERCLDLSRSAHARLEHQFKQLEVQAEWLRSELLKTSRGRRLNLDLAQAVEVPPIKANALDGEIAQLREGWQQAKQLFTDGIRQLQERVVLLQGQLTMARDIGLHHHQ